MNRSTVIKLSLAGAFAVSAAVGSSAFAAPPTPTVTVTQDDGGVHVRTGLPGQPLLSVSADENGICTGFSYQQGTCIPTTVK